MGQDLHTLTGAYALNALTPSESVRFEDHLADCDSCVQEVRGFTETSALLASAAAQTPPEELRERVLAEVAQTRQLAPAPERLPEPRRRLWPWTLGLALAACVAVIIALGATVLDQGRQVDELRSNEQQIAAVLAAPDSVSTSAEPMEGVSVTVVHSESLGNLVFSAHGLDDLHDEDYQLWLTRHDGSVYSAGVLSVDDSGFVLPVLAAPDEGTEGVAVTVEPEGGSDQPTSDPVMAMPVTG
ncbi:MAG: anti-sigma factor [Nocardiopsis sp. BM-2018]|uniref:Regulator of SigK n=1 Tax=Nocardiopsis metallicus TaxID=179819 RepID=A0A840WD92_9ACTN|nr:anti-sigma factor [Nocardiopsis metallicus]MBB5494104.1 anti-sigma-K factor RskA [Nocardiopsis metallicus]QRN81721.1 MAG: anti-sigma factor [Nocardiopsis sp. BM-2018]